MTKVANTFSPYLLKSILSLLLTDEEYAEQFFPILKPEHFDVDDKMISRVAYAIWGMYEKYGKRPSVEALAEEVFKQKGTNIDLFPSEPSKEELLALFDFFTEIIENEVTDKKYVEDNTLRILGFLSIQKVILDHKEAFTNGSLNVEDFTEEIVTAGTFTTPVKLGVNLYDNLDLRTEERTSTEITPGLVELNIPHFAKYLEEGGLPPGSLAFFLAPTNGGKCLRKDELVLMSDGRTKKVQNVVVGDFLMGPDSKPRKVLSVTNGIGPMYNIIPNSGNIWGCNDRHVLTLQNTTYTSHNRSKNMREIIDIPLNEYLLKSKTFKHKYKLFIPDQIEFSKIENPIVDPYFLGLYFGDGTKSLKKVQITTADKEIADYTINIADKYGLKIRTEFKKDNKALMYNLSSGNGKGRNTKFNSNQLLNNLRTLVGKNFTIPDCIKYGSIETRKQFLAGFIDTDGYLHHGFYEIIQKRKDYIEDLAFIARSLGLRAIFKSCTKTIKSIGFSGEYWKLNISGETSKIPVRLERKKHKQLSSRKQGKRTGFKVEPVGIGEYFGFELDVDGRFLLGDFTVTHNSSALIHISHDAALHGHNVLYVTAELSEDMVKRRFDACMTGTPIHEIKKLAGHIKGKIISSPQFIATAKRIQVVEVPMGATKVSEIDILIERLKRRGFNTNLLVVDYADHLKASKKSSDFRHEVNSVYTDLRALAMKHHLVCWTASQMNDAGSEAAEKKGGVITVRHVNEARGKIHLCDCCIAIARTQDEKDTGIARLILLKNRLGSGDGAQVQVTTRFDVSRVFGEERDIVRMSTVDIDTPIAGLEGLTLPPVSGEEKAQQLREPSSLSDRYGFDE